MYFYSNKIVHTTLIIEVAIRMHTGVFMGVIGSYQCIYG